MSLFRKSALDALSNPEKLDQPLKLLRPGQWLLLLSLGSFCLSTAAWIILGKLPVRISGQGVLVRQNSLLLIQAETTGNYTTDQLYTRAQVLLYSWTLRFEDLERYGGCLGCVVQQPWLPARCLNLHSTKSYD